MITQPANIELLTQQLATLSTDRQAVERQLQQLLQALEVGQVIEAEVSVRSESGIDKSVLVIEQVPFPITDEQAEQLQQRNQETVQLKIQQLSKQRIELKIVERPVSNQRQQTITSDKVVDDSKDLPDSAKQTQLLDVINKLNPDKSTSRSEVDRIVTNMPVSATPQLPPGNTVDETKPLVDQTSQKRVSSKTIITNQPLVRNTNSEQVIVPKAKQPVDLTSRTNKDIQTPKPALNVDIKSPLSVESTRQNTDGEPKQGVPQGNVVSDTVITNSKGTIDTGQQTASETRTTPDKSVDEIAVAQPKTDKSNNLPNNQTATTLAQDTNNPRQQRAIDNTLNEQTNTVVTPSKAQIKQDPATGLNQVNTDISKITQEQGVTSPADSKGRINSAPDIPNNKTNEQANPVLSNQGSSDVKYRSPDLKLDISLPNPQQYPLLAQTVQQASGQLLNSANGMTDQLNKLLNQLQRLNDLQTSNKRQLRSENGQLLNRATDDLKRGIKDLQRYIPNPQQLNSGPKLKKALRQSGMFFEQKQLANQEQMNSRSKPSIHHDFKANLQRLISASIYHLAKLSTGQNNVTGRPVSTNVPPGTASSPTTTTSTDSVLTKTSLKTDLVGRIKQRLHGFGSQSMTTELPRQVEQLLRQILRHSNESMNRVKLNQLGNLRPDTMSPQWFFELPIMNNQRVEPVQIFINREDQSDDLNEEQTWSLVLQFNIHQLGRIRAILKWHDQRVNIQFIAEHKPTTELITNELDFIRGVVQGHDVNLDEISVRQQALKDIGLQFTGVSNE